MPSRSPAAAIDRLVVSHANATEVRAAVEELLQRAQVGPSEFAPPCPESVIGVLAVLLAETEDPIRMLTELDATEVWLAAACTERIPSALRVLEARYVRPLDRALAHMRLDPGELGEVRQRVLEKLLGAADDGVMRIARYAGRGRLASMAKVIGVRSAVDLRRASARRPEQVPDGDEAAVDRIVDGELGPELAAAGAEQRALLKDAFQAALADLDARQRGVLRLHLLERVGIDGIAALHSVHRSTAARWLTNIRTRLGDVTRTILRERHGLQSTELASLLRLADSKLDVSLSRVLAIDDE